MTPAAAASPLAPPARPTVRWPPRPGHPTPPASEPTGKPSRAPDAPRSAFILERGVRAHRVLGHVAGCVFHINAILSATNPGTYSRKVERTRIHRILWVMSHAGLVRLIHGHGWTATAAGVGALRDLAVDRPHPQQVAVQ